jgi:2,4-dienoyl-CoA reductase-like NADH-dependent reductase (Old Yellow Enzyme family)
MPNLNDPIRIGALDLPNRVLMAPLTRSRATEDRVPTDLMLEYYVQRASAGLIISEATCISPLSVGYERTPGIWSNEQVAGWRRITDAVHDAGGRIFLQLWHVGRISHPILLNGETPVAPSAIAPEGRVNLLRPYQCYVTPRALAHAEIAGIVEDYRRGAENAQGAGFDGVELHGANGYLLDGFLQDSTNKRTDEYGGSIENRARLMLEVVDAAISVWGPDRVGLHLSPRADIHSMGDSDLPATFTHVSRAVDKRKLAFLLVREHQAQDSIGAALKQAFGGVYVANEQFTVEAAERAITEGAADAVAFGVKFIANPDLPARIKTGAPLNEADPETFYGGGAKGYVDYPALQPESGSYQDLKPLHKLGER